MKTLPKSYIFLLLFTSMLNTNLYAVIDTLRHYNPATIGGSYAIVPGTKQYARFEPKAPGYVKTIIVTLGGADSGIAIVYLYGHEGGTPRPKLEQNRINPVIINKTKPGIERVAINLSPAVWFDNNQFFVGVGSLSSGITLIKDSTIHPPVCSSSTGGIFYYVCQKDPSGTPTYDSSAYAIDVVMDYTNGTASAQYFQDVTAAADIGTTLSNLCIAWSDINSDGYPDLLAGGKLYKNNADGTFADITASAGITTPFFVTTFIDMNNDGKDDILFLNKDTLYNVLYINNGNETFSSYVIKLPAAPITGWIMALSVADINNDKYPDLFVGELWNVDPNIGEPNYLFLNDGNLGFTNVSALFYPPGFVHRQTRGSMWNDYNDDGKLDLYVANYRLQPDELWRNNGNGTFTNVAASKGLDIRIGGSSHGTGCDWADYDNDGDMDLLLPQLAHPEYIRTYNHRPTTLYRNTGAPSYNFNDMNPGPNAGTLGIQYEETHAGATWGDVNRDGLMDFFITAFYGCRYVDFYLQKPDHTFELKSFDYGTKGIVDAQDAVLIDYDNDGDLDLACGANGGEFRLYKNNSVNSNNYVKLDLVSTSGNTQSIGAKVEVYAGGQKYTQYQMPHHGALMCKSNRLFFGLGNATSVDSVIVRWPNGTINAEKFTLININTNDTLTEGSGQILIGVETAPSTRGPSLQTRIYPNPASEKATLYYQLGEIQSGTVEFQDVIGNRIKRYALPPHSAHVSINTGEWDAGIYFYKVTSSNGFSSNGKLVIQ